jgi:hypothetical protein
LTSASRARRAVDPEALVGSTRDVVLEREPEAVSRHGIAEPRGQDPVPDEPGARFGRMFALPPADPGQDALRQLFGALVGLADQSKDSAHIFAGYTYVGQFIDHDITFDPTSKLGRDNDPAALVDFRTPRFDLDSVYGSGPEDEPFLYDWKAKPKGVRLLIGGDRRRRAVADVDLPRNAQGRALIGDKRNDENLITAQLHLLFLRFHNRVVDRVLDEADVAPDAVFDEARRQVRWHYQWIVAHDFLRQILGEPPPALEHGLFAGRDRPYMPVEFSAAAFRFGHSMVRPDYTLRRGVSLPIFQRGRGDDLSGFRPLPAHSVIHWPNFFKLDGTSPQMSKRIDLSLAGALSDVPPDGLPLAWLNLQRGRALGLPAGRKVARALKVQVLSEEQLMDRVGDAVDVGARKALGRATPLWYYVLREAEILGGGGLRLGPVGGRIVGEVLVGLLEADPSSYVRQRPDWKPTLAGHDDFTMRDLIAFVGAA